MLKSSIDTCGNKPCLSINGVPTPAMAYTTYFEERSRYGDFIDAGYRIFFVNVSMTASPINSWQTGFTPFQVGVFEDPEHPNYSELENAIEKILAKCPDAVIFPRIYVSMPKWWVNTHPDDVIPTPKGGYREALFSEAFRQDGAQLLAQLVRHIMDSDYADRVGGWQICGGQTQEWFHHDFNGSLHETAKKPYLDWLKKTYGMDTGTLPKAEDFIDNGHGLNENENAQRYALFCNVGVAETVNHFAKTIKEITHYAQVVGAFYGYSFEPTDTVLLGSHALRKLLDSPYLDFFSSPNAYTKNRSFGIDWADMLPVDSVKQHGKLCFIECDIRTHLTTSIQEARPNVYPDDMYRTTSSAALWKGPSTVTLSREALRKCFAHQITKASAIWWFDMWGGWYHDPLLMDALIQMKRIYDNDLPVKENTPSPEVVFFADEESYANLFIRSPQLKGITRTRTEMGNTGAPFDSFLVEDAERVLPHYKAAVFSAPFPSQSGKDAMEHCKRLGIPYLTATAEHCTLTSSEIQTFLKESGVHLYTKKADVIYLGNGYIGLHSSVGESKTITLPKAYRISPIFGAEIPTQVTDTIRCDLPENATALFSILNANE